MRISTTVRDVTDVDLCSSRFDRLELLSEGACLHFERVLVRYQGPPEGDAPYALLLHDARLIALGVTETLVRGPLRSNDPVTAAVLLDEDGEVMPWRQALLGAEISGLRINLRSRARVMLRCSRATLGLEDPGFLLEGWLDSPPPLDKGAAALALTPQGPELDQPRQEDEDTLVDAHETNVVPIEISAS